MPLKSILRISSAVWVAPILIPIVLYYASSYPPATFEPYTLALSAAGEFTVAIAVPVCAACAAWEAGRLRRAGWYPLPHVRSPLAIALSALAPVVALGWLSITIAVLYRLLGAGLVAVPDLRILAVAFVLFVAHSLLGFAIGVRLPPVVSVPSVLVVIWCWMALPPALEPLWIRHLTGDLSACCDLSSDLAPRAVAGSVIVAAGLGVSAVLLVRQRLDLLRFALAVASVLVAFGLGTRVVYGMGPYPAVPRSPSALVCSSGVPRVCIWPEHRERLKQAERIIGEVIQRWRVHGIRAPREFSEQSPDQLPSGTGSFMITSESRPGDIVDTLAYGMLPPYPACALADTSYYTGQAARDNAYAWLAYTAGVSRDRIASEISPGALHTIEMVRAMPRDSQLAWLHRNLAHSLDCGAPPRLGSGG